MSKYLLTVRLATEEPIAFDGNVLGFADAIRRGLGIEGIVLMDDLTLALAPEPREAMKNRVVRMPDRVWDAAKAKADEKGETVSEAVRRMLERYAR